MNILANWKNGISLVVFLAGLFAWTNFRTHLSPVWLFVVPPLLVRLCLCSSVWLTIYVIYVVCRYNLRGGKSARPTSVFAYSAPTPPPREALSNSPMTPERAALMQQAGPLPPELQAAIASATVLQSTIY